MGLHGGCDRQTGGCAAEGRLRRAAAEAPGRGEMGCGCRVVPGKGQDEHGRLFGLSPGMGVMRSTPWLIASCLGGPHPFSCPPCPACRISRTASRSPAARRHTRSSHRTLAADHHSSSQPFSAAAAALHNDEADQPAVRGHSQLFSCLLELGECMAGQASWSGVSCLHAIGIHPSKMSSQLRLCWTKCCPSCGHIRPYVQRTLLR